MCRRNAATFLGLLGALTPDFAIAQSGLDQRATVYIQATCEDTKTGSQFERQGTGFIIKENGHLLTASHVISCWDDASKTKWRLKTISARIGSKFDPQVLSLDPVDDQHDTAILRINGNPKNYQALKMCSLRDPPPETKFTAAGFPNGGDYQPVDGKIGNLNAGKGRWSAAALFSHGMSGGPVAYKGFVVGLVSGGLVEENGGYVHSVSVITPIYFAGTLINVVTGLQLNDCAGPMPQRVEPRPPKNTPQPDSYCLYLYVHDAPQRNCAGALLIPFENNEAHLTSIAKEALDDFVLEHAEDKRAKLLIAGHANRTGSKAYNQKLSKDRAEAVKNYLRSQLKGRVEIVTEGKSWDSPLRGLDVWDGLQRRVEISVTDIK